MKNNPVKVVRRICGQTQAELADLIDCARLTVHTLESGKLNLSEVMAEKISLHTGASRQWMLNPKRKLPPVAERDPERPFTLEVFKMTRAEIDDPRIEPLDVVAIEGVVAAAYRRLCDVAWQAYSADNIIYFNYLLREFLHELEDRWQDSRKLPDSSDVTQVFAEFAALMEKTRVAKVEKTEAKGPQPRERANPKGKSVGGVGGVGGVGASVALERVNTGRSHRPDRGTEI